MGGHHGRANRNQRANQGLKPCTSSQLQVKHKAEPHNYIEFFLVTETANEVLAVSAEDHGNSHYHYQSVASFSKYGPFSSKNRADTMSW